MRRAIDRRGAELRGAGGGPERNDDAVALYDRLARDAIRRAIDRRGAELRGAGGADAAHENLTGCTADGGQVARVGLEHHQVAVERNRGEGTLAVRLYL